VVSDSSTSQNLDARRRVVISGPSGHPRMGHKSQKWAVITDRRPAREPYPRKELVNRLLKGRCEICASTDDIYVHQVARLADLAKPGPQPEWIRIMTKRRRKTLVVCRTCYDTIRSAASRPSTQ
jgi:hypothetical protein